ncbi:unnamed protein product [Prorocentrum cordatum]|uniref:Protein kinase domain-containing protein n=1 Tax=Prorocentrum cordatum TaxID=2364126 RepID=A0ABN9PSY9_9DINO|nr:unnamed protein product [Polarella glacialis]
MLALSLLGNLVATARWIASELSPSDRPSRLKSAITNDARLDPRSAWYDAETAAHWAAERRDQAVDELVRDEVGDIHGLGGLGDCFLADPAPGGPRGSASTTAGGAGAALSWEGQDSDDEPAARASDRQARAYASLHQAFLEWARRLGCAARTTSELDIALARYLDMLYFGGFSQSRGQKTVAALRCFRPECEPNGPRGLVRARAALSGFRRRAPGGARRPLPRPAYLAILGAALRLRLKELALAIAWGGFLRLPTDIVEMVDGGLVAPSPSAGVLAQGPLLFPSEAARPSKVGHFDEGVLLRGRKTSLLDASLHALKRGSTPPGRLWSFDSAEFRRLFARRATLANLGHMIALPAAARYQRHTRYLAERSRLEPSVLQCAKDVEGPSHAMAYLDLFAGAGAVGRWLRRRGAHNVLRLDLKDNPAFDLSCAAVCRTAPGDAPAAEGDIERRALRAASRGAGPRRGRGLGDASGGAGAARSRRAPPGGPGGPAAAARHREALLCYQRRGDGAPTRAPAGELELWLRAPLLLATAAQAPGARHRGASCAECVIALGCLEGMQISPGEEHGRFREAPLLPAAAAGGGAMAFECGSERSARQLLDQLSGAGRGGFGRVYLAHDTWKGEEVAVKAFFRTAGARQEHFHPLREAAMLRWAEDPLFAHFKAVYELSADELDDLGLSEPDEDDDDEIQANSAFALVTEYLPGGDLFAFMKQHGPVSEDAARKMMQQVFAGLASLHKRGIMHRDIKPENVLLTSSANQVRLVDFGLASFVWDTRAAVARVGSIGYIAPEVLTQQSPPQTTQVDCFSAGVLLYTCLAGHGPFQGRHLKEVLMKNVHTSVNAEAMRRFPPGARDLLAKLLEVQPERRPTAHECLRHPWLLRRPRCAAAPARGGASGPPRGCTPAGGSSSPSSCSTSPCRSGSELSSALPEQPLGSSLAGARTSAPTQSSLGARAASASGDGARDEQDPRAQESSSSSLGSGGGSSAAAPWAGGARRRASPWAAPPWARAGAPGGRPWASEPLGRVRRPQGSAALAARVLRVRSRVAALDSDSGDEHPGHSPGQTPGAPARAAAAALATAASSGDFPGVGPGPGGGRGEEASSACTAPDSARTAPGSAECPGDGPCSERGRCGPQGCREGGASAASPPGPRRSRGPGGPPAQGAAEGLAARRPAQAEAARGGEGAPSAT